MIKCPNCGQKNMDGTILCEGCAWDVAMEPSVPDDGGTAGGSTAGSAMSFDVMPAGSQEIPLAAEPISTAPLGGAPEALPAEEFYPMDAPVAEAGFADTPIAEAAPIEDFGFAEPPLPAVPMSQVRPPTAIPPTSPSQLRPPTAIPPAARPASQVKPPTVAHPPASQVRPPTAIPPRVSSVRPPTVAPPPAPRVSSLAPEARPKLIVVVGQRKNAEYPLYDGDNFIGRSDETPADIDLGDQEPTDKIYASRQHACVSYENGKMFVRDLGSANGTYLNRQKLTPNEKKPLKNGDYIQTGGVMFMVRA